MRTIEYVHVCALKHSGSSLVLRPPLDLPAFNVARKVHATLKAGVPGDEATLVLSSLIFKATENDQIIIFNYLYVYVYVVYIWI